MAWEFCGVSDWLLQLSPLSVEFGLPRPPHWAGDSFFTQLPHAVVDVHHPFPLGHVQHDVNDDETAGPARTSTARTGGLSKGGQKGPPLLLPLRSLLG